MKRLPTAITLLAIATLSGCGITSCIDALFPRPSQRLPGSHTVELRYKDQPPISAVITCERFYDAMCAARGNQWAIREIGTTEPPSVARFLTIQDPDLGEVRIPRPSCEVFGDPAPERFWSMIYINRKPWFHSEETEDGHVFVRRKYGLQQVDPAVARTVTLKFTISLDGKALLPPLPSEVGFKQE